MKAANIGFAGTDARTLLSAFVVSNTRSAEGAGFKGVVLRGMPAMPKFAETMGWPVEFIPTQENTVADYAAGAIASFRNGALDFLLPMPEDLQYQGFVDLLQEAGWGDKVAGFTRSGSFVEGDKIACKRLCREYNVPVADDWQELDARNSAGVIRTCLEMIDKHGGAVLKYPYSAGGKGARIILSSAEVGETYALLMKDYAESYRKICGEGRDSVWPLLAESRMAGVEISFTALVDGRGSFQMLPTAMDYPERFPGPPGKDNPITGGMGSISPHPLETDALMRMTAEDIIRPFIKALREKGILRPCVLYPGCIVSITHNSAGLVPTRIRMCEMNIRPGEPEFQPIALRLKNLGPLVAAMFEERLNQVAPEVKADQLSMTIALVVGSSNKKGEGKRRGYPWSHPVGEPVTIDFDWFKKNPGVRLIPSAMSWREDGSFVTAGSRVVYLAANVGMKAGEKRGAAAERLRQKLLAQISGDSAKIKVVPEEDPQGNRLDFRGDVGSDYGKIELLDQQ